MAQPDKIPPQALDAEKGVLGSMLIEKEAVEKTLEYLEERHFYKDAHRKVFAAVIDLYRRGEAADLVTVSEALRSSGHLEGMGGVAFLSDLIGTVTTAAHVEHYARLVREKAVTRDLIRASTDIIERCYASEAEAGTLLDEAEARIFDIAQRQTIHSFKSSEVLAHDAIEHLEHLASRKGALLGVPTGFADLDRVTGGFQKSDLIIVAARPGQGKTSLALNLAANAGMRHNIPVAVFSMEMSQRDIFMRMLCAEARANLADVRKGFFKREIWPQLTSVGEKLAQAPIWIDDSPGLSVMEVRTRTRRLASDLKSKGKHLGLVVVDYLQLLRGDYISRKEGRQQEVSEISRQLKHLARDLNIPVVALSQLNRSVEEKGREGRPQLSDLRECVTGDTVVCLADGRRAPIAELAGTTPEVLALGPGGRIVAAKSDKIWRVGRRPVFTIRLATGRSLRCTARHRLFTGEGWKRLEEIRSGDRMAIARVLPEPAGAAQWPEARLVLLGHLIGDGSFLVHQPLRYTTSSEDNSRAVASAATGEFATEVKRYRGRRSWHQLLLSGNGTRWEPRGVNAWLRGLGIFGQRSHEKRIPAEVFTLGNDQIALLLRHLWATDGTIYAAPRKVEGRTGNRIFYSTNSPGLATDVAALLLRLGIVTRTYSARKRAYKPNYNVTVSGSDFQRLFLERVGAFGPRSPQSERLSKAIETLKGNTNVDTLPPAVFRRVREAMKERGISQRRMAALRGTSYGGTSHFRFAPSRATAAGYAEILDDDGLRAEASSDIFWDTVASIEPAGEEDVFDLTVPGPASWLADGIVSHNSGAIEQDADLVGFIYREEYYKRDDPSVVGKAELIIAKHRNGPTDTVQLRYTRECTRFDSLLREAEEPAFEADVLV